MAAALTVLNKHSEGAGLDLKSGSGPYKVYFVTIAFTGTYSTNGEALDLTAADGSVFPAADIWSVDVSGRGGYVFEWDAAAKKLKAFTGGGAELANASGALTTIGTFKARIWVRGG